jgi:hypothetical protein
MQTVTLLVLGLSYRGVIVRTINRSSLVLRLIKIEPGSGESLSWVVEFDGATAEAVAEGADASTYGADKQAGAILPWGAYMSNFHITELAERAAGTTQNPIGANRAVARDLENSASTTASLLNKHFYTGTYKANPRQLEGLERAVGDDSNVYAGLDRTDAKYELWRPHVFDDGKPTELSFSLIEGDLDAIYEGSGFTPRIAFVSVRTFGAIRSLFSEKINFIRELNGARGPVVLDATEQGIEIGGCVFLRDKDAPKNSIFYVNPDEVTLRYLPDVENEALIAELQKQAGVTIPMNDGMGPIPLGMRWEPLAKTGASSKYMGTVYPQLEVRRPNRCGVRRNLAVA